MKYEIIEKNNKINITVFKNEEKVAKATCYYINTPKVDEKNIGTIGELEIKDKEIGIELLKKCEDKLREKNINKIVTPMNGNTWKQYRTLKYTNGEDLFLLENINPIEYNEIFKEAGYKEINTYTSTKGKISDFYNSEILNIIEEEIKEENIKIRKFNKRKYLNDLEKIYNISIKSFSRNPFYTDINKKEFIEQYDKYINYIDEDFVYIAEKEEREIGFVFCIPNLNELKTKGKIDTLILKTIAVLPEYEEYGIGNLMVKKIAKKAMEKGFKNWIFAFMHNKNTSQKMAKRNNTKLLREYALYGKEI